MKQKKRSGVFLIHGLMGSPKEYRPLESTLTGHGYLTHAIALPGHGPSPAKPFYKVSTQEILDHCLEEYERFACEMDEVVIVGHSLGGICTLITASQSPSNLAGVVTLSTPYEHAYWVNRTHELLTVPLHVLFSGMRFVSDSMTGFERPEYTPWMFPRLLNESRQMFKVLQSGIPQIQAPVCLAHSRYDLSIPFREMEKIAGNLGNAKRITTHILDRSGHQIFPMSQDCERTTQHILDFIYQECPVTQPAA